MSEEKELIKRRASFKGRLTVFGNYLQTLSQPITVAESRELQLRLGKIESLYEQYDEVQLKLECLVDNMQIQLNERAEFETLYYKILSDAQGLLCEHNKTLNNSQTIDKSSHASNHRLVKLPTIQLPKFGGSYDSWLEFRDTFMSLIHSNDEMDEINKFHYLRASLEGSAAVVIQSVDFSANNYTVAWMLLCERYDNKRLLIQNHVSALFNLDAITRESSTILKHLIDNLNKNLRTLESLGEPVKQWDTLLIYIVTQKLDTKTYREWEEYKAHQNENTYITFDIFLQFLRNRADLIETLELSRSSHSSSHNKSNHKLKALVAQSTVNLNKEQSQKICQKCKGDHTLYNCPQFLALSSADRLKSLSSFKICFNCFRSGHFANTCKKPGCKICKRRHNTLVHVSEPKSVLNYSNNNTFQSDNTQTGSVTLPASTMVTDIDKSIALTSKISYQDQVQSSEVLLSTALIKLCDSHNQEHIVRAVLDSGSTSCLMTTNICHKLNLPTNLIDKTVLGINNVTTHVGKTCRVTIKSLNDEFTTDIYCYVLPSITNNVPSREIDIVNLKIPSDICLADPMFYKPSEVDILIGADLFWDLIGSQRIKLGHKKPVLCETRLGWIISGPSPISNVSLLTNDIRCNLSKINSHVSDDTDDIRTDLMRFWQLEEINSKLPHYSPDEKICEEHFIKNTFRLTDGRFCVRIPLKRRPDILGNSYQRAKQCLFSLERRLNNKPEISKLYHEFMMEYQQLGHMTENETSVPGDLGYFMPHHGILREGSTTTKLRVVFNASCPTTSGVSFNEIQLVGPTVQDDLLSILLRFRQHKYILSADVEKMYRQIIVHPSDRHLQQILWRTSTDKSVKTYRLNTVTYGTASAPFLATRCLKQIGLDCEDQTIAEIIQHDFYVDDLLSGGDDICEVQTIRTKVTELLASAGMSLRKWVSNEPRLVPDSLKTSINLNIGSEELNRLLGLGWHASADELCFPIGSLLPKCDNTKRDILSAISRIFDPLGLLSPCVIVMKMLLQKLWLHKLTWDEPLTSDIITCWNDIITKLPLLNIIRIPRRVICDHYKRLELHIFMDASERAYGSCVYVRSVNESDLVMVRLLMAKSRVAPIKPTTIPRLELCGALIAARLYEKVMSSLRVNFDRIYFWTDSTIVLGWLRMLPSKLQPFVRNRVAEVLDKAGNCTWKHVPTDQNPADLISRGVDISALRTLDLWWSGPEYLTHDPKYWPSQPVHVETLPETRPDLSLNVIISSGKFDGGVIDFERFSNYSRLVRSVAYAMRFVQLCKRQPIKNNFLHESELQSALSLIIKISQVESFPEYKLLLNKQDLPNKSSLIKYNVFLDQNQIMRVGGRIGSSEFSYDKKYPILIQSTHVFTKLLFDFEHKRLMHAGPQLLLASIRETFWPIGGRNLSKTCYHKCVLCTRLKGKIITPVMGNLPPQRLVPDGYPFQSVGVDYAGPIVYANRRGRGCKLIKAYIAIFICFTTKAVHLELVGDLTSNSYLLALRRFISRRGKPIHIYSDNGTSFVGAYNDLSKFLKDNCNSLSEGLANEGINFHFIPAYSPHFGGLWEAGVKSTKHHLVRVLGNCNMTFEELNTVLTQIEAILNSRPLTPLSSDPADYNPLTPGHFLIGRPLTSLPHQDVQQSSYCFLTRYQRIEQLRQHFWARWSKEYVAELQQRIKWRSCKDGLKLDTLVVVKEDNLPPLKWKLGRIIAVYPGSDGIVRVADIRTSSGVIRRAFNRICPLPISASG